MSFIPIKSTSINIFSGNEKKITEEVIQTISYCKMLVSEAKKTDSYKYIRQTILEHMYIIYYCFKCVGIVKLTSNLNINHIDQQIEKYLDDFYSNRDILNMFDMLRKKAIEEKNKNEIYFFDNMLDKCFNNQKHPELKKEIKKISNEIFKILENEEIVNIPPKLKKYFPKAVPVGNLPKAVPVSKNESVDLPKTTYLMNRKNYYMLQKKNKKSDN